MNKIKYLVILVFGITISSCQDAYNIEPDFILTEETSVNSVEDLERVLLGTYDNGLGFIPAVMANAYPSDNLVIGGGNAGQGIFGILWQYTSSPTGSVSDGIWNSAYASFYSVNRILKRAEAFEDNPDLRDQIIAEALAIRAYSAFELVRFYSPTYDATALSGYIVTEPLDFDADNIQSFSRNTVGEMVAQINEDIDRSMSLMGSQNNVYRFSPVALKALQSRVNLYVNSNESLNEAIELTSEILAEKPLADSTAYVNMFKLDRESSETILKLQRDQNDAFIGNNFRAGNGAIYVSMSYELESLLSAGDVRREVLLDTETEITTETVDSEGEFVVGKYIGRDENFPGMHDLILFRSSEMLLIRAEAYARQGMLPEAQADIESLRLIRGSVMTTPDYIDEGVALNDILLARRVELAYEGHRFLDLKRFGKSVSRSEIDASINRGAQLLPVGNFRFTFPIPQAEIDRNDGIQESDQNPGYGN
jgi:starch-binding outer membrane protein, SusD/RagB family